MGTAVSWQHGPLWFLVPGGKAFCRTQAPRDTRPRHPTQRLCVPQDASPAGLALGLEGRGLPCRGPLGTVCPAGVEPSCAPLHWPLGAAGRPTFPPPCTARALLPSQHHQAASRVSKGWRVLGEEKLVEQERGPRDCGLFDDDANIY